MINRLIDQKRICTNSFVTKSCEILLNVDYLFSRAPQKFARFHMSAETREQFHRLIEAGADASAAIILVGKGVGYLVSCSADGSCLASVILPGMDEEVSAEGANFALALIAAYIGAIIDTCSDFLPQMPPYSELGQTAH